jgi:hypothetical protein
MATNIIDSLQRVLRRSAADPAQKCRKRFLRFFPRGFKDKKYFAWERGYKVGAHEEWEKLLNRSNYRSMLKAGRYKEIAAAAARIESRTNLLFSFEKMAFRDAVRESSGAKIFAEGLYDLLYGRGAMPTRFENWCEAVAALPRRQTRVMTNPVVTIFPFIAQPDVHIFLKPNTTKRAAQEYGFHFEYASRPSWQVYGSLLEFAGKIGRDLRDLGPRDMIDIQSFIWAVGSDEYRDM